MLAVSSWLLRPDVTYTLLGARPLSTTVLQYARKWKFHRNRDLVPPPMSPNTEMPERHRLSIMPKTPNMWQAGAQRPPKGTKELWRMMGEERVHKDLLLGQFGIVSLTGGMLLHKHFEVMRMGVGRFVDPKKTFSMYRVDAPYKPITNHGFGKRMGGGKGGIDQYGTPVRAGKVILEIGGQAEWAEVQPWLSDLASKLPFHALAVSAEQLERLRAEEERLLKTNKNPINFEWIIRNNIMNCQTKFSEYDLRWFGKFTYKDRELNKKWQWVTRDAYHGGKN